MEVLPHMELWLGLRLNGENPDDELHLDPRAKAARIIRDEPPLNAEQWRAICAYYLENAPEQVAPVEPATQLEVGMSQFRAERPAIGGRPMATLARFDPELGRIYVGGLATNLQSGYLSVFDLSGARKRSVDLPSPPVDLEIEADGLLVTLIGDYTPSDRLYGLVIRMPRTNNGGFEGGDVLKSLPRPAMTEVVDLNADGLDDFLVCGFGNTLGGLLWFEAKPDGGHEKHVLLEHNGVVCARTIDIDKDGRLDVVVMTAQQRETVQALMNRGDGTFEARVLLERHPAWGFTAFELADLNGDGHPDLVTANGG